MNIMDRKLKDIMQEVLTNVVNNEWRPSTKKETSKRINDLVMTELKKIFTSCISVKVNDYLNCNNRCRTVNVYFGHSEYEGKRIEFVFEVSLKTVKSENNVLFVLKKLTDYKNDNRTIREFSMDKRNELKNFIEQSKDDFMKVLEMMKKEESIQDFKFNIRDIPKSYDYLRLQIIDSIK